MTEDAARPEPDARWGLMQTGPPAPATPGSARVEIPQNVLVRRGTAALAGSEDVAALNVEWVAIAEQQRRATARTNVPAVGPVGPVVDANTAARLTARLERQYGPCKVPPHPDPVVMPADGGYAQSAVWLVGWPDDTDPAARRNVGFRLTFRRRPDDPDGRVVFQAWHHGTGADLSLSRVGLTDDDCWQALLAARITGPECEGHYGSGGLGSGWCAAGICVNPD